MTVAPQRIKVGDKVWCTGCAHVIHTVRSVYLVGTRTMLICDGEDGRRRTVAITSVQKAGD